MNEYAAFLGGINVGGKHRVNMAELAGALSDAGFTKVRTYIQSGNILFSSGLCEPDARDAMEKLLENKFGFFIPVILRSLHEVQSMLDKCPFPLNEIREAEVSSGAKSLHICMMQAEPKADIVEKWKDIQGSRDRFFIIGRDVYLLLYGGVHLSKLAGRILKTAAPATMRNRQTIQKMAAMALDMAP